MKSGLSMLPKNMTFPALTELFLQDNYDLSEIPLSFFEHMPTLMVLDMSRTSIKDLPASISHLVQLKILMLRDCKLLMVLPPEIRALQDLEVFDLEGTELICIPEEIKMLKKLERLVVSLCDCADEYVSEIKENGKVIPRNTLSNLSNLKELSIFVDPSCKWWCEEITGVIMDLLSLKSLKRVKLYFPSAEVLNLFFLLPHVRNHGLKNFRLIVGRHDQGIISRLPRDLQEAFEALDKCLKFVNGEGSMDVVGRALRDSSALFLGCHWTLDQLTRFKFDEIGKLRFCLLVECNEMTTVIDGYYGERRPLLQLLEYLSIYYMKNLESLSVGPLASESFHSLKMLDLHTCPNLKTIFSAEMLINVMNLEELIVEDCPKVVSIVSIQFTAQFLPNLKKIALLHLPGLVSVFSGSHVAPRLESMVIFHCPKLASNSLVKLTTASLEEIKGESVWWEALTWKNKQPPNHLSRVFVPFSGDGLISELAEARNSRNTLNIIHSSNRYQDILDAPEIQTRNLVQSEMDVAVSSKDKSDSKSNPGFFRSIFNLSKSLFGRLHRGKRKDQLTIPSVSSIPKTSKGPNKVKYQRILNIIYKFKFDRRYLSIFNMNRGKHEKLPHLPDRRFNPNKMSWQKVDIIGTGSFGPVYEGITENKFSFAIKEVITHDWDKQRMDQLEREISVLSRLKHENIVQYFGTKTEDSKLYIFLELTEKRSLASLYKNFKLRDSRVSAYTRKILVGLSYLHSQNVAHMDIKCANIFVDLDGSVKLADFGLAKVMNKRSEYFCWMSPEFQEMEIPSLEFELAADIWSLGCSVLEMLTGKVPYFPMLGLRSFDKMNYSSLPDIPDNISDNARDFILKCLQVNPDNRPSAVQLLNHAFLKRHKSAVTNPYHAA